MLINSNYDNDTKETIKSWATAIGLQQVDGLTPSKFLQILATKNINGLISNEELETILSKFYKVQDLSNKELRNKMECDIVSNRIVDYLNSDTFFEISPKMLKDIHYNLFKNVYSFAGNYRKCNLDKEEDILNGNTVTYADYNKISDYLDYDFNIELNYNYDELPMDKRIKRLARFISNIWQAHPFREGNTRTISVFLIKYLKSRGYNIDNSVFMENSLYFRNALAIDNHPIMSLQSSDYLIKFFENLILNTNYKLDINEQNNIIRR